MLDLKEAVEICKKNAQDNEIIKTYEGKNKFYFALRSKDLKKDEMVSDDPMIVVNSDNGEVEFTNYATLILKGISIGKK